LRQHVHYNAILTGVLLCLPYACRDDAERAIRTLNGYGYDKYHLPALCHRKCCRTDAVLLCLPYPYRDDAERAIRTLNGYGYDNLILHVEWAAPRAERS
jgi:hypothetical protein